MIASPVVHIPVAVYILIGVALVLLVWSLLSPRKTDAARPELPRRRTPITDDERELRYARLDAVLAQSMVSPGYLLARLGPYEAELSELLELGLELDDVEGDHAQPHP